VTAVVAGHEPDTFGGALESVFLNTFYARWMFVAGAFGQDCVVGKSMLFRKSDAERFGGIVQLGRFLAEDFMTGQAMRMLGLKVAIMKAPIRQPLLGYKVQDFWRRHIRWGRIRKAQAPLPVLVEPWVGLIPSGIAGAFAFHGLFGFWPEVFLCAHVLGWFICDMSVVASLGERTGLRTAIAWLTREIIALPLWIHMMSGNTVNWRGARLRVRAGGLLETP
jgi:ceramide glucosyltransferase